MSYEIFKLFLIIIIFGSVCYGVQKTESDSSNKAYLHFQSIHLDITSLIYVNDFSLSSDFEIYRTTLQNFGFQIGFNYLIAGSVGGSDYDSPYQDINLLAYTFIGHNKIITTQLLIGYALRISSEEYAEEYPVSGLKYGVNFILNLDKYFKVCVKYNALLSSADFGLSAVGLGVSIGWSR
jgi:hypothetical protein